jgi:hypothetical protein
MRCLLLTDYEHVNLALSKTLESPFPPLDVLRRGQIVRLDVLKKE